MMNRFAHFFQRIIAFDVAIIVVNLFHAIHIDNRKENLLSLLFCLLEHRIPAVLKTASVVHPGQRIAVIHCFQFFNKFLHFLICHNVLKKIADNNVPIHIHPSRRFGIYKLQRLIAKT